MGVKNTLFAAALLTLCTASVAVDGREQIAQSVPCITPLGTCLVFGLPSGATCFCGNVAGRVP